jgi:hypothetical protein
VKHAAATVAAMALALAGCASTSPEQRARSACAWVLWSATAGLPSPDPYRAIVFFPRAAYDTHDQCEEARAQHEQMQEQMNKELVGIYLCLPDTVDPRGPKTK